ncbi:MAG: PIN domain-containing protein [Bacteroidota bacterium]
MIQKVMVDTSVWIDFFNGVDSPEAKLLADGLEDGNTIFLCPTIIQEVLQGIKKDSQFRQVKEYLLALDILNDNALELSLMAADVYRYLRKRGVTIRKSNDCLIASYAIRHKLSVLHKDRDFDLILDNYK